LQRDNYKQPSGWKPDLQLPMQLLSYHMSVARGFDPDFPRNLSKTMTVD
jgi:glucosamine 6-phosphate synthetase-like amidotransferase/phosphosugar isomerase protein